MNNILCIDDDTMSLGLMTEIFDMNFKGVNFITKSNALEAIQLIKSGARFDLVITDCDMPHASGFDVVEACIEHGITHVIMMSGNPGNLADATERFHQRIHLQTFSRPFSISMLVEKLSELKKKQQEA